MGLIFRLPGYQRFSFYVYIPRSLFMKNLLKLAIILAMSISLQAFEGSSTKSLKIAFTNNDKSITYCEILDLEIKGRKGLSTAVLHDCDGSTVLGTGVAGFNFKRGSSATITLPEINPDDGSAMALILMIEKNPRKWYLYSTISDYQLLLSGKWTKVSSTPSSASRTPSSTSRGVQATTENSSFLSKILK